MQRNEGCGCIPRFFLQSDSGAVRTLDPQLRRLLLYPTELRNPVCVKTGEVSFPTDDTPSGRRIREKTHPSYAQGKGNGIIRDMQMPGRYVRTGRARRNDGRAPPCGPKKSAVVPDAFSAGSPGPAESPGQDAVRRKTVERRTSGLFTKCTVSFPQNIHNLSRNGQIFVKKRYICSNWKVNKTTQCLIIMMR